MSHFFCYLTPGRPDMHGNLSAEEGKIFGQHCDYLEKKFASKEVLQAGTSFEAGQEGFAIVILAAPDKRAAVELIQADPAVAKGLLKARVTEYDIFLDRGQA
ncbi:MAG: hypothetical protein ACXWR1_21945 [Bdellovibrionota bacterium]